MEKQHNRGQDGAGIATVKLDVEPGYPFMNRLRSNAQQAIADIFQQIGKEIEELEKYHPDIKSHPGLMKGHVAFLGELLLGHLRYGTQGKTNWNTAIHLSTATRSLHATWRWPEISILSIPTNSIP